MPLIYNDKTPDLKIKVFGKSYYLHREVLEKSEFFQALISEKWSKGEKITIECKDVQEEKCILRVIDHLYGHFYDFEGIKTEEMLKIIEVADYLGDAELVKDFTREQISMIEKETMREMLNLGLKLYEKDKRLYDACLNIIASNIEEYTKWLVGETNVKILYDLTNRNNLWFSSEYERYRYGCKLARRFGIKDPKILMGEYKGDKIDKRTMVENWFTKINYYQLSSEELEEVIVDGYLSIDDIRKIIPNKKRYCRDKHLSMDSRIALEFELKEGKIDITSEKIKCGIYTFKVRVFNNNEGIQTIGVYLKYEDSDNEDKIKVDYDLILPPSVRTGQSEIRSHTLTLKKGEVLGYTDEITWSQIAHAKRNNFKLRLILNINSITVQ